MGRGSLPQLTIGPEGGVKKGYHPQSRPSSAQLGKMDRDIKREEGLMRKSGCLPIAPKKVQEQLVERYCAATLANKGRSGSKKPL